MMRRKRPCAISDISKWVLILLVSASALAGSAQAREERLVRVEVRGQLRLDAEAVLERTALRSGIVCTRQAISRDLKALMRSGYFKDVRADLERTPEGLVLTWIVEELPWIREVVFSGNDDIKTEEIEEAIAIKKGTFLRTIDVERAVETIRKLYVNEGYYSARISYRIEGAQNNQSDVIFEIVENKEIKVGRISFVGNQAFTDKELRRAIETSEKNILSFVTSAGAYKEDVLRDDVARLTIFYLNSGYVRIEVDEPDIVLSDQGIFITFRVKEGEIHTVGEVDVLNVDEADREKLLDTCALRPEETFSRDNIQRDVVYLTDYYGEYGYAFAGVNPIFKIDDEARTVGITYEVTKGEKVYFEDISIAGNEKTRDKVVRRELFVAEGDLYSGSKLRRSREMVYRLGFFEDLNFETMKGSGDDKIKLNISLREGQTGTINGGAGFSSTDKFIFMASVTQSNLFGLGQEISLNVQYGGTRKHFALSFTEPWLFDIPLSAGFDAYRSEYDYHDFTRIATGGSIRLGYPIYKRLLYMYWRYKNEMVEITDLERGMSLYYAYGEGRSTTSSMTATLVQDTLNHRLDPSKGGLSRMSLEYAGDFLGGDNDFIKISLDTRWYVPLKWGTTFMVRGRMGLIETIGQSRLPIFERFFVGGISTVRGFDVLSLGPAIEDRAPDDSFIDRTVIGGNKELIFNTEFIFPLMPQVKLKGFLFFDAGNAYSEDEDIRVDELRMSTGFGFRWLSPLGPLVLAIGYPLDLREGEDSSAVQFTIGTPY